MTTGIHHVTGITANVQANVDFYAGFLGLRLVKQTGGYEDPQQLHLLYGDALGSPGTLLTFLVWETSGRGRTGLGQVSEIALAVAPDSIGEWLTKALAQNIPVDKPAREFGETVLRLRDPDGMIVKLVGLEMETPAPMANAPTRLRGVTLLSEKSAETADFIARFGYASTAVEGPLTRMTSDTDVVDIRQAAGFVPSIPGAGVPDHVAFRAVDVDAVRAMRIALGPAEPTHVHDRKYFFSLYVREPGGALIEYATDAPGVTVDEPAEHLGETLFFPPDAVDRADDLRMRMPQFALPGAPRLPQRDLDFIHRFHEAAEPDGRTLVLLHGTAGDESDLMPFARRALPGAQLLGLRGRATEEGSNRWFRRLDLRHWDQPDVLAEAEAFAAFVQQAMRAYALDPVRITFVGYSNGAGFLGAVMRLYPGLIQRAALFRGRDGLEPAVEADLTGAEVLLVQGAKDLLVPSDDGLAKTLESLGAAVQVQSVSHGHALGPEDRSTLAAWLDKVSPIPAS